MHRSASAYSASLRLGIDTRRGIRRSRNTCLSPRDRQRVARRPRYVPHTGSRTQLHRARLLPTRPCAASPPRPRSCRRPPATPARMTSSRTRMSRTGRARLTRRWRGRGSGRRCRRRATPLRGGNALRGPGLRPAPRACPAQAHDLLPRSRGAIQVLLAEREHDALVEQRLRVLRIQRQR